jgi:hypothetical protein
MAAPNLIGALVINGKTTAANLTTTNATTVLNNAVSSGKCLKINTINVCNFTATSATVTVSWYDAAALGGTQNRIVGNVSVPAFSTMNIVDKTSQYYLEENQSIGATAGTANALTVTCSYEDIS